MNEWFKVLALGIVQGLTEFLPISSTGHLLTVSALLNFEGSLGGTFEIFIQLGTLFAVILYFRKPLLYQIRHIGYDKSVQSLWINIVVGSIPAAVFGILLADFITEHLFPQDTAPTVIAVTLLMGGFIFLWVENRRDLPELTNTVQSLEAVSIKQAFLIGLVQSLAIVPGVSRSGATIVGGLLAGLDRKVATTFSFYLSIPMLGGAGGLQLLKSSDKLGGDDIMSLLGGAVVAGVVGWMAIAWLLRYVGRNNFRIFGIYRIAAGVALALLVITGNI